MTTSTIEARVADLVAAIVANVEARVETAFAEAIEVELARRGNGDVSGMLRTRAAQRQDHEDKILRVEDVATQALTTKRCSRCRQTKALDQFADDQVDRLRALRERETRRHALASPSS